MQTSAFATPCILPIESVIVCVSSLGSNTVSGNLGLFEVVTSFFTQPDSPINISNRKIIKYLSNSLFIRVFTAGTLELYDGFMLLELVCLMCHLAGVHAVLYHITLCAVCT